MQPTKKFFVFLTVLSAASVLTPGHTLGQSLPPLSPIEKNIGGNSGLVQPVGTNSKRVLEEYGRMPLSFEAIPEGQSPQFVARTAGGVVRLTATQMVLTLQEAAPAPRAPKSNPSGTLAGTLVMSLQGANPEAAAQSNAKLPGKSNYFIGSDPAKWVRNISNYARVEYLNVYPNIDLVYYGNLSGRLEHDFVLKPGADPSAIQISMQGAASLAVSSDGDLRMGLTNGSATETASLLRPVIYQVKDGRKEIVNGSYVVHDGQTVGFEIAEYDRSRELVIDPVLDYSTYLGGGILTGAYGLAVDASGNAYVVGHTGIGSFPTTKGSYDPGCDSCSAAFVAKLNPTGTALLYSTYLSGGLFDQANSVTVDSNGAAYVAGISESSGFPVTKGAVQTKFGGAFSNGFVTKLNAAGSELEYSTYLGGDGPSTCYRQSVGAQADQVQSIAIDKSGDAYVTGCTSSKNFPVTKGALKTSCEGCSNGFASAFAAKLNPEGTELLYSTFLGGDGLDFGYGIAVDSSNDAYIAGSTTSSDLKVSSTAYQKHLKASGGQNAFVTKLNSSGTEIGYSTYLGGSVIDGAYAIGLDAGDHAYLGGYTESSNFPVTSGVFQKTCHDCENFESGFVAALNDAGSALLFSTFLGGNGSDAVAALTVTSSGEALVTGYTQSTDFPTTGSALKKTCSQCSTSSGESAAFFTELNSTGTGLNYSTYLGGSKSDSGAAVAIDSKGYVLVAGTAGSSDFPISASAVQASCSACSGGDSAAFVTAFYFGSGTPALSLSPTSLSFGNEAIGHTSAAKDLKLTNSGSGPLQFSSFKVGGTNPGDFGGNQNCGAALPPGVSCTAAITFKPAAKGSRSAVLEIADTASGSPQEVKLGGTGVEPQAAATFSPTSVNFGDVELNVEAEATVMLTNTGTANLTVSAATITGSGAANFGGTADCGTLTPGGSCPFTLGFEPTKTQTYSATLNVTTSASSTPVEIPLKGTGVAD
jgi:hypothetical protein